MEPRKDEIAPRGGRREPVELEREVLSSAAASSSSPVLSEFLKRLKTTFSCGIWSPSTRVGRPLEVAPPCGNHAEVRNEEWRSSRTRISVPDQRARAAAGLHVIESGFMRVSKKKKIAFCGARGSGAKPQTSKAVRSG